MAKKENKDNHVWCVCLINGILRLLVFDIFPWLTIHGLKEESDCVKKAHPVNQPCPFDCIFNLYYLPKSS